MQANSEDVAAMNVPAGSKLVSNTTCVTGGYTGHTLSYVPRPVTDCPPLADPLADRPMPKETKCDYKDIKIKKGGIKLDPGVYCGGVYITEKSNIKLNPGTYIFIDGDLDVGGESKFTGKDVSLYFAKDSRMFIRNATKVDLSAPRSGDMAGFLVAAGRENDPDLVFEMQSNDAKGFSGMIYTPNNTFKVGDDVDGDGQCDVANDPIKLVSDTVNDLGLTRDETIDKLNASGADAAFDDNNGRGSRSSQKKASSQQSKDDLPGCKAELGQYSDWTAIVARNIEITSGVMLVLNADYSESTIPVPENDGFIGPSARLVK